MSDKRTIELDDRTFALIHELVLHGLAQKGGGERGDLVPREYGEAYDDFVEAADVPHRIGNQPDVVRRAMREEFLDQVADANEGDTMLLDESRGTVSSTRESR